MDSTRMAILELDPNAQLTEEEVAEGWHFCPDWDFMLVGNDTPEKDGCCCSAKADNS